MLGPPHLDQVSKFQLRCSSHKTSLRYLQRPNLLKIGEWKDLVCWGLQIQYCPMHVQLDQPKMIGSVRKEFPHLTLRL